MLEPKVAVSIGRAWSDLVTIGVGRAVRVGLMMVGVVLLTASVGGAAASASGAQQSLPAEPLVVVESFLAARDARDVFGATGWCAPLLALHDVDGLWILEEPSTRYWLEQLTDKYVLDTLSSPLAEGNRVTWTERLTPRGAQPAEPWSKTLTITVTADVEAGTIAQLSGPYPPIPVRPPNVTAANYAGASATTGDAVQIAPATMFFGAALTLTVTALLVTRGAPAVRAVLQRIPRR